MRPNLNQSTQAQTHSCQAQGIENKSTLGERTESYMQRERREHGGQGSGAHALHTVIWSVARGNHNSVDAETSLSLSLHISIFLPRPYTFFSRSPLFVNIKDSRSNWWITAAAGRGQMSQPRVALARPAPGPASAAGLDLAIEPSPKKEFNADFSSKRTGSDPPPPPPPPNEHRSFLKKMSIIGDGP